MQFVYRLLQGRRKPARENFLWLRPSVSRRTKETPFFVTIVKKVFLRIFTSMWKTLDMNKGHVNKGFLSDEIIGVACM